MKIDDFICPKCKTEYNNIDKDNEEIPLCCGVIVEKNWAHCNTHVGNGGQAINSRLCNDNQTINKHFALDDPLCKVELGLQKDHNSGMRTFTPEQAKYFREKAAKDDSVQLRQEILDTRSKNRSERKSKALNQTKIIQ